jgi:L-fuculose-phosphate aldolase
MDESQAREFICEIGRRVYTRQFAAANDGNISLRISENEVLATPTMVCKGFLKPHELVKMNMSGEVVAGYMTPTSETKMHIGIYKIRPDVKAVVHAHPPHATAFAVSGVPVDKCVLPEVEIFLGEVPTAPYATPGTQDFFQSIEPYLKDYSVILQANHGVVALGGEIQQAYWRMEIVDAYCRMLILSRQLGNINRMTLTNMEELFQIKRRLGLPDRRLDLPDVAACDPRTPPGQATSSNASLEEMVQRITEEVLRELGRRST